MSDRLRQFLYRYGLFLAAGLYFIYLLFFTPPVTPEQIQAEQTSPGQYQTYVTEDGEYISKDDVAEYIYVFGRLPKNYITKEEAQKGGWDPEQGKSLEEVFPGRIIGGSRFGNYDGLLPEKNGRQYYECDVDYTGGSRNSKRIVYSNDGLIFYTEDHYKSFEQLH